MLDLWKGVNGRHYLGVSIMFITSDWKMHVVALALKEVHERHTADTIVKHAKDTFSAYGVYPVCFVADNAANAQRANATLADWSDVYHGTALSYSFAFFVSDLPRKELRSLKQTIAMRSLTLTTGLRSFAPIRMCSILFSRYSIAFYDLSLFILICAGREITE